MSHSLILIPGFGGSELVEVADTNNVIWVSYVSLAIQHFKYLALSPDGITPLPPDAIALQGRNPLDDFYDQAFTMIADSVKPDRYVSDRFGYDWRKGFIENGLALANFIRTHYDQAESFTLVAHSMGGLVSRAAWRHLGLTGHQGKVRRVITLGTSHQGSYSSVLLASGDHDTVGDLYGISNLFFGLAGLPKAGTAPRPPLVQKELTRQQIADIIMTFPGYYDLLPSLGGTDEDGDPNRALIYQKSNWPASVGISQAWLTNERDVVDPWLADPLAMPPSHVLTTVAGYGRVTPWGLDTPSKLGTKQAIGNRGAGDGTVTIRSALVPTSSQWMFNAAHMDLPYAVAASGQIRDFILEERQPDDPPPPLATNSTVYMPRLRLPPFPGGWPKLFSMGGCSLGDCSCPNQK